MARSSSGALYQISMADVRYNPAMTIPVLDLQSVDAKSLDAACAQWGFFALQGHGSRPALKAEVLQQCDRFFSQPRAVKNRIRRSQLNSWGYYDAELTKNQRDWKEILDIGPPADQGPLRGSTPQWPALEGFAASIGEFRDALHDVATQVLEHIVRGLDPDFRAAGAFENHSSFLRLNYYPPCPAPAAANAGFGPDRGFLGISHHTDAGAVTVLSQDRHAGLQVYQSQRWHLVEPPDDALVINIGDIVQVWSNDRYRAPLHRVLAHTRNARISIPYFLNPDYMCDYAPLPGALAPGATPLYHPINWGEFRARRSSGDYTDNGEEVQISDFRRDPSEHERDIDPDS
jgi:isopenicillin N synthase-like dioxygenase